MNAAACARCIVTVAGLSVLSAGNAAAQREAPVSLAPVFRVDRWTTAEGLPGMAVTRIRAGPDGHLWLIASGSVVRFDGYGFQPLGGGPPDLRPARTFDILPVGGDTVFVLSVRWAPDTSVLTTYVGDRRLGELKVPGIWVGVVRDGRGALWLQGNRSSGVVARFAGGLLSPPLDVAAADSRGEEYGSLMAIDRFGDLWLRDAKRDSVGRVTALGLTFAAPAPTSALITRPSTRDILSASRIGQTITVHAPDGARIAAFTDGEGRTPRLVDRSGRLWVSTSTGLEAFVAGSMVPVARVPLPDLDVVDDLIEDREGNLWARATTQGIYRIREQPVVMLGAAQGVIGRQVMAIARGPDRSMLLTDARGAAYRYQDGVLSVVADPDRPTPVVLAWPYPVEADSRGTVWLKGTIDTSPPPAIIIGRRADRGMVTVRTPAYITLIREDPRRDGTIWAGGGDLLQLRPDAVDGKVVLDSIPIGAESIRSLAFDKAGALWTPSDAGLVRIFEGQRAVFSDSLWPGRQARSLHIDSTGAIWIGTYGLGLLRYKDSVFRRLTERDGLAEDVVSTMLEDDAGNLWMAGNRSVHRASLAQLHAFMDGTVGRVDSRAYTQADGIPNPETSGWAGARDATGRLWFPTFDGAAIIDPARAIALDNVAPLVHVGAVHAPSGAIPRDSLAAHTGRIAARDRRFEIAYTAIALRDPQAVRFRYRLDGFDKDWNDAGTSRTATYTGVRGGHYTFRVAAINAGGVRSETDATLEVFVAPRFRETAWFLALAAIGIAGLGYLGARWRLASVLRRQEELDRLVAERTAMLTEQTTRTELALSTVAEQADKLRALDVARSRMFSNVSHEFRTPLTLIVGPLRDLKDGRLGALPPAARDEIDVVLQSSERLNTLVEELLDVARLEAGELKLQLQGGDVVAFLRRISRGFEPLARARRITYRESLPDESIRMAFDPARLEKVLNNLLGNAFKFTGEGGTIALSVAPDAGGQWVRIAVKDTGIGIPADALARVFERFYQVDDSSRRQYQGTGVGLALARELVELHGGTIDATSVEGEGSEFVVHLPVAPAAGPAAVAPVDEPAESGASVASPGESTPHELVNEGPTVLIVEDNPGLRAWLRRHLEASYAVVEAVDGVTGLETARRVLPDVVVSDVMMPNMDGQEMLEAIRADPSLAWLPVILLTARASHESRLTGLRGGADDYITKPFDIDEVLLRVGNLIASRRRLRDRLGESQRVAPTIPPPISQHQQAATQFVNDLQRVIQSHLDDEDFGVDALAVALNMSRSSLYRRAQDVLGRPPMDVVWESRLDLAARWLRETDAAVNEIAYGVGFKSVPHFSRKFRERFGMSPSEARVKGRG